jgi:hypothetical protein
MSWKVLKITESDTTGPFLTQWLSTLLPRREKGVGLRATHRGFTEEGT